MWRGLVLSMVIFLASIVFAGGPGGAHSLLAQDGATVVDEAALGSGFTYQGLLTSGTEPVNGNCHMTFRVFDALNNGNQVGNEQAINSVAVANGFFTVALNGSGQFGPTFASGEARWLQVSVRCGNEQSDTTLPRQALSAAPYALTALSANGLRGRPVSANAPQNGQALIWNGSEWTPQNTGGAGADTLGALNCTTDQVALYNGSAWVCSDAVKELKHLLAHFSRSGDDITITAANLHIVDGTGDTDGEPNGLGNVIIGYNELRASVPNTRTGSHMLVVGKGHNYSGFGGIVIGAFNETSGDFASVSGGGNNIASGGYAVVSGGQGNRASGDIASVSGGQRNTASGIASSVSGGDANTASSGGASVSGGQNNIASSTQASVSGGAGNIANGFDSWVGGGFGNTASGSYASISGGHGNTASGDYASVSGGRTNTASGEYASVSGGNENAASGSQSSVSGGRINTASGIMASASGGQGNKATGPYASVSGGFGRTAFGDFDWVAGALIQGE